MSAYCHPEVWGLSLRLWCWLLSVVMFLKMTVFQSPSRDCFHLGNAHVVRWSCKLLSNTDQSHCVIGEDRPSSPSGNYSTCAYNQLPIKHFWGCSQVALWTQTWRQACLVSKYKLMSSYGADATQGKFEVTSMQQLYCKALGSGSQTFLQVAPLTYWVIGHGSH